MKKRRGCLIACMAAAIAALLFTGAFVFAVAGGFVDYRLETYDRWHGEQTEWAEQREGRSNPMPSLNELKTAQKVQFQQYTGNFWGNEAYTLIAKYQRDQYEDVKRSLEETLMFETEVIDQGKKDSRIEPEFVMERFDVRLLKTGGLPYAVEVPKHMYFFGTSNDSCEILYIYYHDVDLDSVSGTLEESVPEYIHWPSMKWLERMPILQNFCLPVI